MKKKTIKKTINGKSWKIRIGHAGKTNGVDNDGICDYASRIISINPKCERSFLNVLCHELLHARFPDLEEDSVEDMGTLLAESYEEISKIS